jgi:hypothetical protein
MTRLTMNEELEKDGSPLTHSLSQQGSLNHRARADRIKTRVKCKGIAKNAAAILTWLRKLKGAFFGNLANQTRAG